MDTRRGIHHLQVIAAGVAALLLAALTLLLLVDGIYRLAEGGPSGLDAHETMAKVGYWFPLIAFAILAPIFALSVWLFLRLKRQR